MNPYVGTAANFSSLVRDRLPLEFLGNDEPTLEAVEALAKAYHKLKPPEPKFRVGKVVMIVGNTDWTGYPIKIGGLELLEGIYKYESSRTGRRFPEDDLRALTESEQ